MIKCKEPEAFLIRMKQAFYEGFITAWSYNAAEESWSWICPPVASSQEQHSPMIDCIKLHASCRGALKFNYVFISADAKIHLHRYLRTCEQFKRSFSQIIDETKGEEISYTNEPVPNIDTVETA